jgi:cell division protein FtsL
MSKKTAMALLASFMRHAKLGREVEDALAAEQANPPEQQPQEPPKPDHEPEKIAAMREAEASRAEIEKAKLQIEHARLQLEESKLVSTENAHVAQLQLQEQLDAAKRAHELRLKALDIEAKRSIEEMQAQNKLQIEALRGEIQAQISSLQSGQEQARKNTEEAKRSVDDLGGKMAASMGEIMQAIAKMNKTVVLKKDPVTQTISGSIQTS